MFATSGLDAFHACNNSQLQLFVHVSCGSCGTGALTPVEPLRCQSISVSDSVLFVVSCIVAGVGVLYGKLQVFLREAERDGRDGAGRGPRHHRGGQELRGLRNHQHQVRSAGRGCASLLLLPVLLLLYDTLLLLLLSLSSH